MKLFKYTDNEILVYTISNYIGLIAQTISSIYISNILGPEKMGPFIFMLIFSSYIPYLLFGLNNGLNYYLTRINTRLKGVETIDKILVDTSTTLAIIAGLFFSLINFFIYELKIDLISNLIVSLAVLTLPLTIILEIVLRSSNKFFTLSIYKILIAIISLISLLFIINKHGVYLRFLIISISSLILLVIFSRYKPTISISNKVLKLLIKKGFAIFIVAGIWGLYYTSDRLMVSLFFNKTELGNYNLAIIVSSFGMIVSSSISQILYIKLSKNYNSTKKISSSFELIKITTIRVAFLLLPFYILGTFLMPYFINYLMPKYSQGIISAQFILWSTFFISITFSQDIFIISNKIKYYYFSVIITLFSFLGLSFLLTNIFFKIEMIALSFLFSAILFFIVINFYYLRMIKNENKSTLYNAS